jgi:uncharacterized protein
VNTTQRLAVFDTNVLVSGLLSPHGAPGRIVEWLRAGAMRAGLDDRIAAEYDEVLNRPELGLPRHEVRIVLRRVLSLAVQADVLPQHVVRGLPDADDAPFAECALALGCELVSGNKRHFPRPAVGGLAVLSPREFVDAE